MKHATAPIEEATEKIPRLVADEAEAVDSLPPPNDAQEDDLEEDGTRVPGLTYEVPGPAWHGYVIAAVPVCACLFGAGREAWSKGIITLVLALVLLIFGSRRKLPLVAWLGLVGALLAPLLTFLPASWLFHAPAWQAALVQDWGIRLSTTLTPQAAVSQEAWLLFAVCCVWLGWCLTRGFSDLQRRAMMYTLAFGGILLCLLSILDGSQMISISWWPRNAKEWGNSFGPFANRNHISSIAAMTCVLCAAACHDTHRRKSRLWIFFLLGFLPPIISIYMNSSRSGMILLFLGMTGWLGTIAMRRGFFQKLAVSTALVLIISTLLVMSGGNVSKRFTENGIVQFASDGGRSSLFVESLKMSMDAPWTGLGLGNFEAVFPQFSQKLEVHVRRFLHPESDLLWLLAEGGLLTVLPALLLLLWIFRSTGPWFGKKKKRRSGMQDRRLRNAAAIVFILGTLHGLWDVPNHGLGYALFMALLAGIAIRPRRLPQASGLPQRLVFRLAGVLLLALGAAWMAIALGHPVLPGTSAAAALRDRATKLAASGSPAGALPLMDQAIAMAPLEFIYYYERARLRLYLGQPKADALLDFSRARALDPAYALTCLSEGVFWLDFDPQYALVAWRELLSRDPAGAGGDYGYYRQMLNYAQQYPELREPLWTLATSTELKFYFLEGVRTRTEFDRCLQSLLEQKTDLKGLEPEQRERLFNIWYQQGDQAALIAALETNRKWRDDGWRILAEHYARNSEFQRACQTAIPYLAAVVRATPGTSTDIPTLERAVLYNPTDARRGIDLFQAQKSQGDIDGALQTLEKVAAIPNAPAYVRQEIASLYILKEDFRRAWEHLREAMQKRQ